MDDLIQFITAHHEIVVKYQKCYYNRYKEKEDWKEHLRILFINALNAGGEGKVTEKAESIKRLEENITKMKSPTYGDLLLSFEANNYTELFNELRRFKQIGPKKSALFLRDILYLTDTIQEVPHHSVSEYFVPVDRVIVRMVNSLFDRDYVAGRNYTFYDINKLAKQLFPHEPILLDDLWFWGRFYRCDDSKISRPYYCKFNEDLLAMDINVTKEYRNMLMMFGKKHTCCPFRKFCLNY